MYSPVKKKGQAYPKHPDDNRLVKCYCHDWSPYQVKGAFIPYKKPEKHRNYTAISRFCIITPDGFESDKQAWLDCEKWEYIEEEQCKN